MSEGGGLEFEARTFLKVTLIVYAFKCRVLMLRGARIPTDFRGRNPLATASFKIALSPKLFTKAVVYRIDQELDRC